MSSMSVKPSTPIMSTMSKTPHFEQAPTPGLTDRRVSIQPNLSGYYPYEGLISQRFILYLRYPRQLVPWTHFLDTKSYAYVCRNPASTTPVSSTDARILASILDRDYGNVSCESPVHKQLLEDIATLRGDKSGRFQNFVHVEFDTRVVFLPAKRTGERAGGAWMKNNEGAMRMLSGRKTYVDVFGKTRCAASTDFSHHNVE
ncbi:hypothetical protein IAR50_001687 [Cryptococcus sp. DSM 104548]